MNKIYIRLISLLLILGLSGASLSVLAQGDKKPSEETLTNETIITLTKAGLSQSIIVSKIRSSKTRFDVSTTELLRLKRENVADAVIDAMIQAAQAGPSNATPSGDNVLKADPHDPLSPHEAGIYLLTGETVRRHMVQLDPSVYTQSKSGGMFKSAMTYGIAKVQSKAVLAGERAKLRIEDSQPVFYFYFEVKNAGLSNAGNAWFSSATSPNEFVLLKLETKKNSREVVVGQFNAFGAQGGALDKYVQPFDYEKLAPGVFKVTPRGNLADGEYCFFYGGATPLPTYGYGVVGGPKVFDFGIRVSRLQ